MQHGIPAGELEVGDLLTNCEQAITAVTRVGMRDGRLVETPDGEVVLVTIGEAVVVVREDTVMHIDLPLIVVLP